MDELILRRLILAKTFLISAKAALNRPYDENSLALATIQLHDAVDNLLGAAISYKQGTAKSDFLLPSYDEIVKLGVKLTHHTQIKELNTHRNNIKHQGIIPNSKDLTALLPAIKKFCESTCETVFNIKLSQVSRVNLIEDSIVKGELEKIQTLINAKNYKEAMSNSATVLFNYFVNDGHLSTWLIVARADTLMKSHTNFDVTFPSGTALDLNMSLLEIGIDPYLYYRFRNLTPDVGRDLLTDELVYKRDGHTWHVGNWTEQNALFCFNFVVDALISQQRNYGGYNIEYRKLKHRIRFTKNSISPKFGKHELKSYSKDDDLECVLVDYADGEFQPNRYSANNLTQAIVGGEGASDIYLFNVNDIEVINEEHDVEDVAY